MKLPVWNSTVLWQKRKLNSWAPSLPQIRVDWDKKLFGHPQVKRAITLLVLCSWASEITLVLIRLIRHSYSFGVVPVSWKSALIHSIPKKGDGSDPSNYRSIGSTSLLLEVKDSIINSQLLVYLEAHRLINDRQYGFRHDLSPWSFGDLLVYLTHRWAVAGTV